MFLMSIRMELMKAVVLVSPIEFMSGALEGSCPTLGDADRSSTNISAACKFSSILQVCNVPCPIAL